MSTPMRSHINMHRYINMRRHMSMRIHMRTHTTRSIRNAIITIPPMPAS